MMPKKEISRIPYPAKQRLSLWLQLHPIPEMQHQLPHLIATRMVLHFLWIIRPTLDGSHYAGRQWVKETTDEVITLPIAFSKIKFVVLGTCASSSWIYENVSVLNDSDLSTVTAWSSSENQAGKIAKMKNIIAMGI